MKSLSVIVLLFVVVGLIIYLRANRASASNASAIDRSPNSEQYVKRAFIERVGDWLYPSGQTKDEREFADSTEGIPL